MRLTLSSSTSSSSDVASLSAVRWAPDGAGGANSDSGFLLLSSSHDGTAKVWDIRSTLPLHRFIPTSSSPSPSPSPSLASSGTSNGIANGSGARHKLLCCDFARLGTGGKEVAAICGGADSVLHSFYLGKL